MLDQSTARLWQRYAAAESAQFRPAAMAALDQFITSLLALDESTWHSWAREFAAETAESRQPVSLPVRAPLFDRVLLPALADAVLRGIPASARTLAFFEALLAGSDLLPEHLRTPRQLLREALRVDPADDLARIRLAERLARDLDYALHELPAGVLWDANSASASQCEELLADLNELIALERAVRSAEWLAHAELHFKSYREWLLSDRSAGSYERFLKTRA
jgi:hypothetical protein